MSKAIKLVCTHTLEDFTNYAKNHQGDYCIPFIQNEDKTWPTTMPLCIINKVVIVEPINEETLPSSLIQTLNAIIVPHELMRLVVNYKEIANVLPSIKAVQEELQKLKPVFNNGLIQSD